MDNQKNIDFELKKHFNEITEIYIRLHLIGTVESLEAAKRIEEEVKKLTKEK